MLAFSKRPRKRHDRTAPDTSIRRVHGNDNGNTLMTEPEISGRNSAGGRAANRICGPEIEVRPRVPADGDQWARFFAGRGSRHGLRLCPAGNRHGPAAIVLAAIYSLELRFVGRVTMQRFPHAAGVHGRQRQSQCGRREHAYQRQHEQKPGSLTLHG